MRTVWIISVSRGYLIGLYAFMESLKRYGHKEDVHVLYYFDIEKEDLNKIMEKGYPFEVTFYPLQELRDMHPVEIRSQKNWDCRWYKYLYMMNLDYDMFCIWGGDVLLLNNIEPYFWLAQKYTILGGNRRSNNKIAGKPIESVMGIPLCDVPFITTDKELLAGVFEYGQREFFRQRCRGDMSCIYNTIVEQDKWESIFLVSYTQWVHSWAIPTLKAQVRGKDGLYWLADGTRICSVEGPMWNMGRATKKTYSERRRKINRMFHEEYVRSAKVYGIDVPTFQ